MDGPTQGKAREIPMARRTSVRAGHGQVSRCNENQVRTGRTLPLAPHRARPARSVMTGSGEVSPRSVGRGTMREAQMGGFESARTSLTDA